MTTNLSGGPRRECTAASYVPCDTTGIASHSAAAPRSITQLALLPSPAFGRWNAQPCAV